MNYTTASRCHPMLLCFVSIYLGLFFVPTTSHAEEEKLDALFNKYPASLLFATRTATTYTENTTVLTLVFTDFDYAKKRNAVDLQMHSLPDGMHFRRTALTAWGEYGLTNKLQFGMALPYVRRNFEDPSVNKNDVDDGIGDALLYTKYKVIDESSLCPAIAFDFWLKTSTGDQATGLGNGELDEKIAIEISKRINDFSLHLNPEYTFTGGSKSEIGNAADDKAALNFGVMYHLSPKIIPMAEVNALWWGDQGHEYDVACGALFFFGKSSSIKVGVSIPFNVDMPWSVAWTPQVRLATWF